MADGLDTYEIIEEGSVRLTFKDGSSRLVTFDDLAAHLHGRDLAKVKRAVSIRQNFIKTVLPPWAKVVVISVGAFALVINLNRVAGLFGLKPPEIVEQVSPSLSTAPKPSPAGPSQASSGQAASQQPESPKPQPYYGNNGTSRLTLPLSANPTATEATSGRVPISPNASPKASEATGSNPSVQKANSQASSPKK